LESERAGREKLGERFEEDYMRRSNVALRLQPSLLEEARRVAQTEGVALNQLINVAIAEKLSALRTEEYFFERAGRGSIREAKRILRKAGKGNPPVTGDEVHRAPRPRLGHKKVIDLRWPAARRVRPPGRRSR
jgi:hypothetical protein